MDSSNLHIGIPGGLLHSCVLTKTLYALLILYPKRTLSFTIKLGMYNFATNWLYPTSYKQELDNIINVYENGNVLISPNNLHCDLDTCSRTTWICGEHM
jgi:hypothetical protein